MCVCVSLSELSSSRDTFWFSFWSVPRSVDGGKFRGIESVDPDQTEVSGQDGPSFSRKEQQEKKQEECCAVKKKAKISVCSVLGL